ncbi:unnamed protein product [Ambrosiozyma monospora]|uniref:Unnamed protein product n=1 Tax=Ambrosiozyma monospora TaxID=43982 RepID=A0A9W6YZQ5_AMBMO|nr:unnamed protein product [Ambrosiozyma monospora]
MFEFCVRAELRQEILAFSLRWVKLDDDEDSATLVNHKRRSNSNNIHSRSNYNQSNQILNSSSNTRSISVSVGENQNQRWSYFQDVFDFIGPRSKMDIVCCYHHLMIKLQLTNDVSINFSVALDRIIEKKGKDDAEAQGSFLKSFTKFQFKSLQFTGYLVDSRTNESFILMREIIDMLITKLNPKHVSLHLSGMSILPSLQWSNYITELYDLRSGDLKTLVEKLPRFKKLKIVNVNKKAFSDSFDVYQLDQLLSHASIEKCVFAPSGPLPSSIQVDLVTLVSKMDSKLELHLANFFLPLDNSTFTLLTNATKITDFNLVPRLMYTSAEYTQFDLFAKIDNIKSLHVKIPDIKDIVLRNDTVEDLKITFTDETGIQY